MLICCGATLARDPEELARLQSYLTGIDHLVFDRVTPHSTVPSVTEGVDMARETGVDGILAFGGGSAVVSARAMAIGLAEDAPFRDLATRTEGGRVISPRLENPKCPVFVVQTTPNTASVKVGTAVMDPETRRRLPIFDHKTRTRALFLNPAFLDATPVPVVRIAALQTLSQTIEGLESGTADPFALVALRHAMDLTAEALPRLGTPGAGVALALSHAAALTGEATDHIGGGAIAAALSHTIASVLDLPTGDVVGPILPHTIRFNGAAGGTELVRAFGADPAEGSRALLEAALPEIAEAAMHDFFMTRNPVPVREPSVLRDLLEEAY